MKSFLMIFFIVTINFKAIAADYFVCRAISTVTNQERGISEQPELGIIYAQQSARENCILNQGSGNCNYLRYECERVLHDYRKPRYYVCQAFSTVTGFLRGTSAEPKLGEIAAQESAKDDCTQTNPGSCDFLRYECSKIN